MLHGLILYPRATRSTDRPWRPVYPSWRRVATTWPSRGQPPSWGKRVRVRSIPMVYGQKTNHRRFPVDPTIYPTCPRSVNPFRPTTARNAADVGLSRSCTEVDPAILPLWAKLQSRKSLVPYGLDPGSIPFKVVSAIFFLSP